MAALAGFAAAIGEYLAFLRLHREVVNRRRPVHLPLHSDIEMQLTHGERNGGRVGDAAAFHSE